MEVIISSLVSLFISSIAQKLSSADFRIIQWKGSTWTILNVTPVCLSDSYELCFYRPTALIMIAENIIFLNFKRGASWRVRLKRP